MAHYFYWDFGCDTLWMSKVGPSSLRWWLWSPAKVAGAGALCRTGLASPGPLSQHSHCLLHQHDSLISVDSIETNFGVDCSVDIKETALVTTLTVN